MHTVVSGEDDMCSSTSSHEPLDSVESNRSGTSPRWG